MSNSEFNDLFVGSSLDVPDFDFEKTFESEQGRQILVPKSDYGAIATMYAKLQKDYRSLKQECRVLYRELAEKDEIIRKQKKLINDLSVLLYRK